MSKSNNKAIEEIREIWLKLTAKENEKHSCRCYNVFIFTFEYILLILLILFLLVSNILLPEIATSFLSTF